jgi:hypothetical protein
MECATAADESEHDDRHEAVHVVTVPKLRRSRKTLLRPRPLRRTGRAPAKVDA